MEWLWHFAWELWEGVVDPDKLATLVAQYQYAIYVILAVIVFCETGLVVTPFLPGDSMLFAAGAVSCTGGLNLGLLILVLGIAAILGDTVNYGIGHYIGPRALTGNYRFLKKEYLDRTHRFFERYGGSTIILARFVPIVRTFAPFVAGVGAMHYAKFIVFNVIGGLLWVVGFTSAGYFFGSLPIVKSNFKLVLAAIVVVSVLPMVVEYLRFRFGTQKAGNDQTPMTND